MANPNRFSSLARIALVASLALGPTAFADDDDPSVTVYKEGSVPLKKPAMTLQPLPEYSVSSQLFNFPTGLRILMQSDRTHPIVTFHGMVNHGSGDDPPGMGGMAHFTEHTWFKSEHTYVEPITGKTDVIPKMKIMDLQGYIGAVMNATTFADYTDYKTTASSEFKDLLMQYESWRLSEPYAGIEEDEISVEVNVILNEWRRRNEQSYALFQDLAPKAVYPADHPYANRSTKETLEKIHLADLQKFFDSHYRPEEATVVVVGDFDPIEASSLIFRNFDWKLLDPELDKEKDMWIAPKPGVVVEPGTPMAELDPDDFLVGAYTPDSRDLPAAERPRYEFLSEKDYVAEFGVRVPKEPDTSMPPSGENRVLKAKAPFESDAAVAVWALPGGFRDDEYTLRGLATYANVVISNNMEPRWLRESDPYPDLQFGGCGSWPSKLNTMMFCFVDFDPDKDTPQNALDKVVGQVYHMMDPVWIQINEDYIFNRVRAQYMRDILFNVDEAATPFSGRAEDIAVSLHFTGDPAAHTNAIKAVSGFNAADMSKLVQKYLTRDRYAILHIEPLPDSERDTNAAGSAYAGAAGEDNLIEGEKGLAETLTAQQVEDSWVKPKLDDLEEFYLDNGMRVIVLDHGESPLVRGTLMIGGGRGMKPRNEFDYYWSFRSWDYIEPLEYAGAADAYALSNHEVYQVTAPSGNLDSALYTLRNYVDTAKADMQGNKGYGKSYQRRVLGGWNSPAGHLSAITGEHIYPGFEAAGAKNVAYGYDLAEGGRATVQKYLDGRFQPDNATLIVVGHRPVEDLKRVAYNMFSSWKKTGEVIDTASYSHPDMPAADAGRKVVLAHDGGATQSTVKAACRLDAPESGDYEMAMKVMGSIAFNDTFGTLRVKEGLGYSPYGTTYEVYEGAPILAFNALATNAGVGRVVEYFHEWVEKHKDGFDPDVVASHKLRLAREEGIRAQSVKQMSGVLRNAIEAGETFDDVRTVGERIAAVTPEDLTSMLQSCGDHMVTTISGPKAVLEPKLKEKGIEYELLDWRERRDNLFEDQFAKGYTKWKKGYLKDLAKTRKTLERKCKADPESRACDKLQGVLENEREERKREREKSSSDVMARQD